jgi:hypothetical protein
VRRGPASGRFIPKATADAVPLFAKPIKSAPHVRGWGTRKADQRALVWAVKAKIDAELGR